MDGVFKAEDVNYRVSKIGRIVKKNLEIFTKYPYRENWTAWFHLQSFKLIYQMHPVGDNSIITLMSVCQSVFLLGCPRHPHQTENDKDLELFTYTPLDYIYNNLFLLFFFRKTDL